MLQNAVDNETLAVDHVEAGFQVVVPSSRDVGRHIMDLPRLLRAIEVPGLRWRYQGLLTFAMDREEQGRARWLLFSQDSKATLPTCNIIVQEKATQQERGDNNHANVSTASTRDRYE